MPATAGQACGRCKIQKRRCDKLLPTCSLCKRLHLSCKYPVRDASPGDCRHSSSPMPGIPILAGPSLGETLCEQVATVIGGGPEVREAATTYFATVHTWLPVISETNYCNRLLLAFQAHLHVAADFNLLTLAMFLVCVTPVEGEGIPTWARSLYVMLKASLATMEGTSTSSLDMLQSRLLLTIFEVGHALYPAAYISSGSNVRAAVTLGANLASVDQLQTMFETRGRAEEARRTWHGILITDRFTSLESGRSPGPPLGLSSEEIRGNETITGDPLSAEVRAFLKLLQASRLLDQVLAHIYETTSHDDFNAAEATQILKTMTSFLATFEDEGPAKHVISSSAMAVCRSAMMEILIFGYRIKNPGNEYCTITSLNMLKYTAGEITNGASHVLSELPVPEIEHLSVFMPHCIYKAAIVCAQILRESECSDFELRVEQLKGLLRYVGMRWLSANNYIDAIEKIF